MTTTSVQRKKLRLRFGLLYVVSLLLVFVVMTAFWQKLSGVKEMNAAPQTTEKETYFMQLDTALQAKMESFDELCKTYVKSRQAGTEPDPSALVYAKTSLHNTIDSLDKQASYLSEGPKKAALDLAVDKFGKELSNREALMNGIIALPNQAFNHATKTESASDSNNVETLKRSLQQKSETIAALQKQVDLAALSSGDNAGLQKTLSDKDQVIASLQTQLKQKDVALQNASQNRPASGGDWQQKYQALKASFDKVSASEKSLKSAYQTLADDNRRLLGQLQSARKG